MMLLSLFYLTLILIPTLQQPHVTHKCNAQLQEAECTIIQLSVLMSMLVNN